MWLAERLQDFAAGWTAREDLNPRAHGKVKLDPDIQALEIFGKRAYTNEMSTQRTILNDLLGGKYLTLATSTSN
jgi:protein transport protein DSL1/ZW10